MLLPKNIYNFYGRLGVTKEVVICDMSSYNEDSTTGRLWSTSATLTTRKCGYGCSAHRASAVDHDDDGESRLRIYLSIGRYHLSGGSLLHRVYRLNGRSGVCSAYVEGGYRWTNRSG